MPLNQIRIIVPHLGGGFGAKCELGFEPQVAALAKAAGRPVKVVFSRREEFLLPDHRRERMIIELETGVRSDGTIVARRGHLLIDNGAYSMDEPYLGQMSAMFAVGPYRVPNIDVTAEVIYTNTQPSGSVRAPTGPTTCWALEQHHDIVAERLGLDPVEFRLRNLVHEGDAGPTGQIFERIGAIETLEHAAKAIGWGKPLPDDEAIGFATGWWPSFPGASGAHVTINADGSGTIVTGAQECGTGAVMALPILAAEVLGMRPDEFRILYQDTDAGPYDGGASGSQTTFNNGRAVIAAANEVRDQLLDLAADHLEANRADLELVDGVARVKGTSSPSVTIAELADTAAGAGLLLGRGSGTPPPTPAVQTESCVGRLGGESFAAPTFFTHAARVRIDRDTGVVRVLEIAAAHESGVVINPIGAAGQIYGGVAMGIGQALSEGVLLSEDGRQRNAYLLDYKLQTVADMPPIHVDFVDAPSPNAGPKGLKGIAEPPCVPTPGAIANAIARATAADPRVADDARARVGRDGDAERRGLNGRTLLAPTDLGEALTAAADGYRPVAGGTDLVVGTRQGKWTLPEDVVALDRIAELRGIDAADDGLRIGATTSHADLVRHPAIRERWTALADAAAIVGSPATRHVGTLGGNLANASPAAETSGALLCFDAQVEVRSAAASRRIALTDLFRGPGQTTIARTSSSSRSSCRSSPVPAAATCDSSSVGRWRSRSWAQRPSCASTAASCVTPGSPSPPWPRPSDGSPRPSPRSSARTVGRLRRRRRAGWRPRPRRRSPTSARRSTTGRRWRPWSSAGPSAGAVARARGEIDRHPRQRQPVRSQLTMRYPATLQVNEASYPVELEPDRTLLSVLRSELGLTGSKEGCDDSECGACMVLIDGQPVNSCSYLALQAAGREVTTVEGLASGTTLAPLQQAFLEHGGVQCGFCTPGMLISATALLAANPDPTEDEVRAGLSGNLCRCTGYTGIVAAVRDVAAAQASDRA